MILMERRSSPRRLTCIPAQLDAKPDSQDIALIRDASVSGARLLTQVKLKLGEQVTVQLYLDPDTDTPRAVKSRVVRAEPCDIKRAGVWVWEIGVEFTESISAYAKEIEDLCKRQQALGTLDP
jgi:hypothetical protein